MAAPSPGESTDQPPAVRIVCLDDGSMYTRDWTPWMHAAVEHWPLFWARTFHDSPPPGVRCSVESVSLSGIDSGFAPGDIVVAYHRMDWLRLGALAVAGGARLIVRATEGDEEEAAAAHALGYLYVTGRQALPSILLSAVTAYSPSMQMAFLDHAARHGAEIVQNDGEMSDLDVWSLAVVAECLGIGSDFLRRLPVADCLSLLPLGSTMQWVFVGGPVLSWLREQRLPGGSSAGRAPSSPMQVYARLVEHRAIGPARALLTHRYPTVRLAAATAAGELSKRTFSCTDLAVAFDDLSPPVRRQAIEAAARRKCRPLYSRIIQALHDPDQQVVDAAVEVCASRRLQKARSVITLALERNPTIALLMAVQRMAIVEALPTVERLASSHENKIVRECAKEIAASFSET